MKPHLPKYLLSAVLAASLYASAVEITGIPNGEYGGCHYEDSVLTLNSDIVWPEWDSSAGEYSPWIDWQSASGGTLSGSGSLSAPDSCKECFDFQVGYHAGESDTLVFTIERGITMRNVWVSAYSVSLVCNNTFENAEFDAEGGYIDLSNATLKGSSIYDLEYNTRIKRSTFNIKEKNSSIYVDGYKDNYDYEGGDYDDDAYGVSGTLKNPVLEGDVVLDAGGTSFGSAEKRWDINDDSDLKAYVAFSADSQGEFSTLEITGSLDIKTKTAVVFHGDQQDTYLGTTYDSVTGWHAAQDHWTSAYILPDSSQCLIICSSVKESELQRLVPYQFKVDYVETSYYDESENIDHGYELEGYAYTKPVSGGSFYAVAGADGRVYIYFTTDGTQVSPPDIPENPDSPVIPDTPVTPDEPEIPDTPVAPDEPLDSSYITAAAGESVVLGSSSSTTPSITRKVYLNGGTVDARNLTSNLLNNDVIIGSSGTLKTFSSQTMTLTGSKSVNYSITGSSSYSPGAKLVVGSYGSSGTISLNGTTYATASVDVQGGNLTISSAATLGLGQYGELLNLSRSGTSATNFGLIKTGVEVGDGASLLNQNMVQGSVSIAFGGTVVNNGRITGGIQVASGGRLYGSGSFGNTVLQSGAELNVGNSPGYQHHDHLTLGNESELNFTVDGTVAANLTSSGSGTYSVLNVGNLKGLSSYENVIVNVEITSDVDAYLTAPVVLTLLQADNADLRSDNFEFNLVDNGWLSEDATLQWDENTNSLQLTIHSSGRKLVWAGDKNAVWRSGAYGWMNGQYFTDGSSVEFNNAGVIKMVGTVSPNAIVVNNDGKLSFKAAKGVYANIAGSGSLTKKGAGTLTLNDGNSSWTGDIYMMSGILKVSGSSSLGRGTVYLEGGTLNLASKVVGNDIEQSGSACIKSGKKFAGSYTLSDGELLQGSALNIGSYQTAVLERGRVNGTISGSGTTQVTGMVAVGEKGQIKTESLTLSSGASLTTSMKGLKMAKTSALNVYDGAELKLNGGVKAHSLYVSDATVRSYSSKPASLLMGGYVDINDSSTVNISGKITAQRLSVSDSSLSISSSGCQSITVKGSTSLVNSSIDAYARFSSANLSLVNSSIYMYGGKSQNMNIKGALTIDSASRLSLTGKLSAGNLSLEGGTINLYGYRPQTIKVKNALTLSSGSSINMDYDFVHGKTYKLITFKSYYGNADLYELFDMDSRNCLLINTGNAITLTITGYWSARDSSETSLAMTVVDDESEALVLETESVGPVVSVEENPVADALVQANWGQLEASRAFVNAMANRSMAVQLGNGERAVWASAIGASSRHSSAGGHAGADTNVSGGAFGLETQVGRASLFGMALGNSWTRVSAHGFGTIEQDTTHLGLYGQTNWRSGVTADWSAAYGRSDSETMGSDWSQKHLQLDGRVSYNHELNANTVLTPFAGLQYYASDSATVDGTNTGSLQNLRAEIGVGASRRLGKFGVYGEIAVHQDIARNNPKVEMEGVRYTGMNPGRTGLNFTVGASYELSDKWSVNASYTGEFVENANAHSANVGATYKF